MDHGYGVMSQVSHTTTCKISYIWAHQPLAEISIYDKTRDSSHLPGLGRPLARCGSSSSSSSALAPDSMRSLDKDHHALQGAGNSRGPLTEPAVTQKEQSQRAVPRSVPMCQGMHSRGARY